MSSSGFEIPKPIGATRKKKCVGRGRGCGLGRQSGRGHKGQKARTSGNVRPGFEGGQTPLYRRLPGRGFSNEPHRLRYEVVNLEDLEKRFQDGERVDRLTLVERGLVKFSESKPIKLLGRGKLTKRLILALDAYSATAKNAVLVAGGTVEETE